MRATTDALSCPMSEVTSAPSSQFLSLEGARVGIPSREEPSDFDRVGQE